MRLTGQTLVGQWASGCAAALCLYVIGVAATSDLRLLEAVRNGNKEAVRTLLQQRVDINARQPDGATALHWAAYQDDLDAAELLIRAGADVDAANELGVTPLYLACENGSAIIVEQLLAAGAAATAALPSGETALMTAARVGSVGAVKALLARGADVNAREAADGQTALMWAAAERHPDIVRALIEAGADVHARSNIRRMSVRSGKTSREGAPAMADLGGFTPLLFAVREGDIASVELLLGAGADVNDHAPVGTSALVVTMHSGHGALAAFLLSKGADPKDAQAGYTALHAAVLRSDLEMVKLLLAKGSDPNALLTRGSQVSRDSKEYFLDASMTGATPFFLAAKFANADIMRALMDAGADPLLGLKDGTTPLMVAAGLHTVGIRASLVMLDRMDRVLDPAEVELILAQDEDVRTTMGSGINAVKLVVEGGADVNAVNSVGDTALHGAASHGFQTVIKFLVERGANLNAKNKRAQTPLVIARQNDRSAAADLLVKLGAHE